VTNCYATPDKLYVFEQGEASSTVYKYAPTEVTKMTVDGYVMGIGTKNNVTYILSATSTKTGHSLVIHATNETEQQLIKKSQTVKEKNHTRFGLMQVAGPHSRMTHSILTVLK